MRIQYINALQSCIGGVIDPMLRGGDLQALTVSSSFLYHGGIDAYTISISVLEFLVTSNNHITRRIKWSLSSSTERKCHGLSQLIISCYLNMGRFKLFGQYVDQYKSNSYIHSVQ